MQKSAIHICFLSDSHALYDDRIYWKEALSLRNAGYRISLIYAGENNTKGITKEGLDYFEVKKDTLTSGSLLNYLLKRISPNGLYNRMFKIAASLQADVYHIHDLKVNRLGRKLFRLPHKPKLVYDVHEPYPENIRDYWKGMGWRSAIRKIYASWLKWWERNQTLKYHLIITTEPNMQKRFQSYNPDRNVEVLYNYTNLPEVIQENKSHVFDAIYTGGITEARGAMQILKALKIVANQKPDFKLLFVGSWFPYELKNQMQNYISNNQLIENVELLESVPYNEINTYYAKSRIGLGIFLPSETHRIILQIKIFEYMNSGLPIVGSNFGHIHNLIQKYDCGISLNPENPQQIAEAFLSLTTDQELYSRLSANSRKSAKENFRWDLMEEKLLLLYDKLLNK